jgi:hypothetical protein
MKLTAKCCFSNVFHFGSKKRQYKVLLAVALVYNSVSLKIATHCTDWPD